MGVAHYCGLKGNRGKLWNWSGSHTLNRAEVASGQGLISGWMIRGADHHGNCLRAFKSVKTVVP